MSKVQIQAADGGSFAAYLATPKSGKGPGVVVIQEIFGINAGIRAIADRLAAQGFTALAPDLFWRLEPGVEITDKTQAEWDKAFDLMKRFDQAKGIEDIKSTIAVLRKHPASTGKVGCVGYCLGGRLAFMSAARTDVDASVGYYGVGLDGLVGEAKNIKKPLLLHIAEEDKYVDKTAQEKIKDGLAGNPVVTIYSYPGCDHAFARVDGQHTNKEAAALADGRTEKFLREKLA
jgi:carboxymethylenebutenolidase